MSGSQLTEDDHWLDRWSDGLNPILVKEIRQAFKTRIVTVPFLLAILFAWFLCLTFVMERADPIAVRGPELFYRLMLVLAFALFYVVPYISFRSMAVERERHTFEMLATSTLSNGQIFSGKFNCALLLIVLFEAAFGPFICMTYMLRGLSVLEIGAAMLSLTLIAITLSLFGLMLGSLSRQIHTQMINTFVLLAGSTIIGLMLSSTVFSYYGGPAEFIGGLCCSVPFALVVGCFCWGVTLSNLRPPTFELIRTYLEPGALLEITEAASDLAAVIRNQFPLSDGSPKSERKLVPVTPQALLSVREAAFRLERLLNPRCRLNMHISWQRFLTVRGTSKALEDICMVTIIFIFKFGWADLCHNESLPEMAHTQEFVLPVTQKRLQELESAASHIINQLSEGSVELESPQL